MSCCYSPSEFEYQPRESFTHIISLEDYIMRILILGSKNNKYSSSSKGVDECAKKYIEEQILAGNGQQILDVLREIYIAGRAPKQEPTFMIHAMLCKANDFVLRKSALEFIKNIGRFLKFILGKIFTQRRRIQMALKQRGLDGL